MKSNVKTGIVSITLEMTEDECKKLRDIMGNFSGGGEIRKFTNEVYYVCRAVVEHFDKSGPGFNCRLPMWNTE